MMQKIVMFVLYFLLITSILFLSAVAEGFPSELIPIEINEKWGYADEQGVLMIRPQWAEAGRFSKFVARVGMVSNTNSTEKDFLYSDGLINRNGCYVLPPQYSITETDYMYYVAEKNQPNLVLFGYYDKDSGYFLSPRYEDVRDSFPYYLKQEKSQLVSAKQNGKWGFLNRETGEIVLPFIYDDVLNTFCNGYALVVQRINFKEPQKKMAFDTAYGEEWLLIDEQGHSLILEESIRPVSGVTNSGIYIIRETSEMEQAQEGAMLIEKYGLANVQGEIILTPCYADIKWVDNKTAIFCTKDELWGLMDENGSILIEAKYDSEYDVPLFSID